MNDDNSGRGVVCIIGFLHMRTYGEDSVSCLRESSIHQGLLDRWLDVHS
jgi:hypothetical protein